MATVSNNYSQITQCHEEQTVNVLGVQTSKSIPSEVIKEVLS